MGFIAACSFARLGVRQLRAGNGLVARTQQQVQQAASFCSSIERKEGKVTGSADSTNATINLGARTHAPNNLEKRLLVFTKKYRKIEDIPANINQDVMERCRNQVRIKLANYMMIATAFGCILMILSGKNAQERGESVQKMNLDWHKEYNERAREESEAKS